MDSYDEYELDDAYDEYEDFELEDDEGDDSEARHKKRRRRVPGARQYALGAKGVSSAQISNAAGKTAQLKLKEPAVTVPEFRKAMSEVQRDVQGSAKVIRELREEVDRQQRARKRMEKEAAWSGNATVFVQVLEQV